MPYLGISETDREQMLSEIGVNSIDDLFVDIPENLLLNRDLNLELGYTEWQLERYFAELAAENSNSSLDFKGAGCYRHHVPALVKAISNRGEFLTSYTPYQAEVSQGTLEAVYRFQSYIAELSGMDICNASMYDGATALAEALTMSYRLNKKRPIYISENIHPEYIEVASNYLEALDVEYAFFNNLDDVPDGAAIAIQNPDFYGEMLGESGSQLLASAIESKQLFLIYNVVEPFALASSMKPSHLGAQIVCGSVQSFGNPVHYGGAQVGFIACREEFVRQLPGRVVGKTSDRNGSEGFVLTFQAREQHIKRERASSNICTNQSLHALCTAIYICQMGASGLRSLSRDIWLKANALKNSLSVYPELEIKTQNCFSEFLVEIKSEDLKAIFEANAVAVTTIKQASSNQYLVTVSELHSLDDLNKFLTQISEALAASGTSLPTPHIEEADLSKLAKDYDALQLPELKIADQSELAVCRYFTRLSQKNFSIDTNFYPLGSCTMKYNPKINDVIASAVAWTDLHPYEADANSQGALRVYDELNKSLCEITGFYNFSLNPSAGAHGELSALLIAKKYFADKGEPRDVVLVPDSAHGTNPASAAMAGFKTVTVKSTAEADVDLDHLKQVLDKYQGRIAVFMLTNPSTLGLFIQNIREVVSLIHDAGGLLYYDGANLNAIAGVARPGDMGFDLLHLNLHKTFSTPHGGGGPGAGPIGATKELSKYLPGPKLVNLDDGSLAWQKDCPDSIGRIRSFYGNFNVLLRALAYIKRHGKEGIKRVGETATLNANYLQAKIKSSSVLKQGLFEPYFNRVCKHEFIVSAAKLKQEYGITALDIAKALLDYGIHAPTIYFPMTVPETIMIEPTETETRASLDSLVDALESIISKLSDEKERELIKLAPHSTMLSRFDEVKAVKEPVLSEVMEAKRSIDESLASS